MRFRHWDWLVVESTAATGGVLSRPIDGRTEDAGVLW
jgi:hypothetical protein